MADQDERGCLGTDIVARRREPLNGRVAVVVDDGIATGSTARAACQIARAHGAARVVLAVPVAPPDGRHGSARRPTSWSPLPLPENPRGIVVFVHGSGSSRHSPRNRYVAGVLNDAGLGTLLFDLLTPEEELRRANAFDVRLLTVRLTGITRWLHRHPAATASLWATSARALAQPGIVGGCRRPAGAGRGGRLPRRPPDLAGPYIPSTQVSSVTMNAIFNRQRR